mgnify:CR=1 FL=1
MYIIDATGKKIGRIATEAASVLMGKTTPRFVRNAVRGDQVTITNASKASVSPKRLKETEYKHYSGYPGGLRTETMEQVVNKKGWEDVYRHAIHGMLPSNKLRKEMLKNLTITE